MVERNEARVDRRDRRRGVPRTAAAAAARREPAGRAGSSVSTCAIRRAARASSSSIGSTCSAPTSRRTSAASTRSCTSRPCSGPIPDDALFTRVNVDGTRRVLDAAADAGVRKIVRPSSTAVYGAWANNPVPLTEDAPLRPSPGSSRDRRRRVRTAARRVGRGAAATGSRRGCGSRRSSVPGATSLFAAAALGRPPRARARRGAARCRSCTSTTRRPRSSSRPTIDLDGAYNVAADGWLTADEAAALRPRSPRARGVVRAGRARSSRSPGRPASATRRRRCCRTSCIRGSSRTTG